MGTRYLILGPCPSCWACLGAARSSMETAVTVGGLLGLGIGCERPPRA